MKVKIVVDKREDKELTGKEEKEILNQKDFNWKKKKYLSSGSVLLLLLWCVVKLHTTG